MRGQNIIHAFAPSWIQIRSLEPSLSYDNITDRVERRRRALDILSFYRSIERNNLGVNWLDIFVLLTLDVSLISPQWLILFLYDKSLISNPKL